MIIHIIKADDIQQSQGWVLSASLLMEMAGNEFRSGDKRLGLQYLAQAQETLALLEDMNDKYLGTGAHSPKEQSYGR